MCLGNKIFQNTETFCKSNKFNINKMNMMTQDLLYIPIVCMIIVRKQLKILNPLHKNLF